MTASVIIFFSLYAAPAHSIETDNSEGWFFPTIGTFNGTWELGVGAHFWDDHFNLRNLQFRADLDLAPGLRWHALAEPTVNLTDWANGIPALTKIL